MNTTPRAADYFASDPDRRMHIERAFSYSLRLANGTRRYSYPNRLDDVNSWIQSLLPQGCAIRALDVAVSSGISTFEWVSYLERAGATIEVTATDLVVTGRLLTLGPWLSLLATESGAPLQYTVGRRIIESPPGRRAWAVFFVPLLLLRCTFWLATRRDDRPNGRPAHARSEWPTLRNVDFIIPTLRAHPRVHVMQDDLFAHAEEHDRYTAVRAFNILNRCYFTDDQIRQGVENLAARLETNGLLIIGSTTNDEVNHATAFRALSHGRLEVVSRLNDGSDVEDLVISAAGSFESIR